MKNPPKKEQSDVAAESIEILAIEIKTGHGCFLP
jgi:hypothetical protein